MSIYFIGKFEVWLWVLEGGFVFGKRDVVRYSSSFNIFLVRQDEPSGMHQLSGSMFTGYEL